MPERDARAAKTAREVLVAIECHDQDCEGCLLAAREIIQRHLDGALAERDETIKRLEAVLEQIAFSGCDWSGHGDAAEFYRNQLRLAVSLAARAKGGA